ncbi:Protein sidekick, partial [Fragariocoptes setiger]
MIESLNSIDLALTSVEDNDTEAVLHLISSGQLSAPDYGDILMLAIDLGHIDIVQAMLNDGADVNYVDVEGFRPLMVATMRGHTSIVEMILNMGADINAIDAYGWTSLSYASYYGTTEIAEILLERGAYPNVFDADQLYALSWAAGRGFVDIVSLLLKHGVKVDASDKYGTTPLLWACRKGYTEIATLLLRAGANIDSTGMFGWSPLFVAVAGQFKTTVELLLSHKPNVNTCDAHKVSPLMIASQHGNPDIIKMLLKANAFVNLRDLDGNTCLIYAVKNGHLSAVDLLIKAHADVDKPDGHSKVPLYWAVEKSFVDIVERLLNAKANIDAVNSDRETILMRAVKGRKVDIVRLLLNHNPKVSTQDRHGDTVLHMAVRVQSKAIIELILANPKNYQLLQKVNKRRETPLDIDQSTAKPLLPIIMEERKKKISTPASMASLQFSASSNDDLESAALMSLFSNDRQENQEFSRFEQSYVESGVSGSVLTAIAGQSYIEYPMIEYRMMILLVNQALFILLPGSRFLNKLHILEGLLSDFQKSRLATNASALVYLVSPKHVSAREYPQDQRVILSSTAEMKCQPYDDITSYEFPPIQWIFNNNKNITQSNRIKISQDGTLRIEQVRNTDVGQYTCQWTTPSGAVELRSARLEIVELPHPPTHIRAELTEDGTAGVRVSWSPGFDGNSPIHKYSIEMRTVSSDNIDNNEINTIMNSHLWEIAASNVSAEQNSVIVRNLKPARATNKVGTGQPSLPTRQPVEVPAQPPSAAPMNVAGSPRSSNSITIQWSPPQQDSQNGQLLGYIVRHRLAGYGDLSQWYNQNVTNPAHLSLVLDDLITWQNYEIQVAAYNEKGVGEFSPSTHVRTKEGRPEGAPRNVNVEAANSTSVVISWEPPLPQLINGINQGYKIQAWSDALRTNLSREVSVLPNPSPTSPQSHVVENLQPYTNYYMTVLCFTSAGDGPPNEPPLYVKTKQDVPDAIQTLDFTEILDKSLRVRWTPPRRPNGVLTKYTVEYSVTGSPEKSEKVFPGDTSEAKITDLLPHTDYRFTVYPHTSIGRGPGKTSFTQTSVPPVLPEPPTNLAFSNIGPFSVILQFVPGFDGNASIDKWIVEAQLTHKSNKWVHIYTSTNHTTPGIVTVRNLQPFTIYRLRLIPSNVVGRSLQPSEPTPEFQTLQVEPEHPPKNVVLDGVSSTALRVRWSPLSVNSWCGHPRGYNITWFESPNNLPRFALVNDTEADSYVIKDLEEFTDYVVKIYAVNDVGSSAASDPVTYRTSEDTPSASPANITVLPASSTSISVRWSSVPRKQRNGVIRGYKIRHQIDKPGSIVEYKIIDNNSTKYCVLTDLKQHTFYKVSLCAFTSVGDGVFSNVASVQTHEGLPGQPSNLTFASVSRSSAKIIWDVPEEPNGEILGYRVSYRVITDQKELNAIELQPTDRSLTVPNLDADTHYVFTVSARTKEGWGRQANSLVYTTDLELRATLPFYRESWFVLSVAILSVIVTLIITAILFVQSKKYKYNQEAFKGTSSQDRFGDAGFIIDEDPSNNYHTGFGLLAPSSNPRRSHGTVNTHSDNIRPPPRPHPGSIAYSDGDDDVFADDEPVKGAGTTYEDSSGDSVNEKGSPMSSTGPESDTDNDDEYVNMVNKQFFNHYANVSGTLQAGQQSATWKKHARSQAPARQYIKPRLPQRPAPLVPQHNGAGPSSSGSSPGGSGPQKSEAMNTQDSHTDQVDAITSAPPSYSASVSTEKDKTQPSDVQKSSSASDLEAPMVNLNGGRIIVNNMAGSRAPLPGFTSFV